MDDIVWAAKISNILGCLKFLFFGGWNVDAWPEPTYDTYDKTIDYPLPPPWDKG